MESSTQLRTLPDPKDCIPAPAGDKEFSSQELNVHRQNTKQGEKTMTYSKPEVTKLSSSIEAIQSSGHKVLTSFLDNYPTDTKIATPMAYEADE
jgi:hypothetical protein